jgi:beta-1,4-mannosyltransferase
MLESTSHVLNMLMMPDYRPDNPYQTLLANELMTQNVVTWFPQGYKRIFPIYRALKAQAEPVQILHLHWLNPYLKGQTVWLKLVYCLKFLLDIWLVRSSGVTVIWTIHNVISHEVAFPRLEKFTYRRLARLCDALICHHADMIETLANHYQISRHKVAFIAHGHFRDSYGAAVASQEARQRLGLPKNERIYLNLGWLRPYKGIEDLLTIWQEGACSGQHLIIAGKPMDKDYHQQLVAQVSQLQGVTLQANFIADALIPLFFSAADVVVLPFKQILTSGSLILAMSYGKPIIAPRIASLHETLAGADDLLYEPDDPKGLLKALNQSSHMDLAALAQRTKLACDGLSWQAIGEKTSRLYRAAIAH